MIPKQDLSLFCLSQEWSPKKPLVEPTISWDQVVAQNIKSTNKPI